MDFMTHIMSLTGLPDLIQIDFIHHHIIFLKNIILKIFLKSKPVFILIFFFNLPNRKNGTRASV